MGKNVLIREFFLKDTFAFNRQNKLINKQRKRESFIIKCEDVM